MIRARTNQLNYFSTDVDSDSFLTGPYFILSIYSKQNRINQILNLTQSGSNLRSKRFSFTASDYNDSINGVADLQEGLNYDYTIYESAIPLSITANTIESLVDANIVDFGLLEVDSIPNTLTGTTVFKSSQTIKAFK
jgi:hypothetical protein